jgi:hypothetical protein
MQHKETLISKSEKDSTSGIPDSRNRSHLGKSLASKLIGLQQNMLINLQ